MANEALVTAVKQIAALAKAGDVEGAYEGYRALFASAEFASYRPEDRRQALKLMVHAKSAPAKTSPGLREAHRAALVPLATMCEAHREPVDYEMLGMCHQLLGEDDAAGVAYRAGLEIERARDASSVLCGTLMRRASSV
jgi:hypothetical protein